MPTITQTQHIDIDIEFEVICNTCGCGLCGNTIVKGHDYPQLRIDVCPDCIKAKEEELKDCYKELHERYETIEQLKDEVCELGKIINK